MKPFHRPAKNPFDLIPEDGVLTVGQLRVFRDQLRGLPAGQVQQLAVAAQLRQPQIRQPRLPDAEQLAFPAYLQVELGQGEAVCRRRHRLQPAPRRLCLRVAEKEAV